MKMKGLVYFEDRGGIKPYFDSRPITRGKNKGKIEVVIRDIEVSKKKDCWGFKFRHRIVKPTQIKS